MLEVRDLEVAFGPIAPLSGVSFSNSKGETLGIVGESGSGKSLTAMSVMGLLPLSGGRITAGSIVFDGQELTKLDGTFPPKAARRPHRADHTEPDDLTRPAAKDRPAGR